MNNSQLARAVWGETTDKRGYKVAKNRDLIGRYLAGLSFPEEKNRRKIAAALGHPYEDVAATSPATDISAIPGRPGKIWLQLTILSNDPERAVLEINREMRLGTAAKILALLDADDAPAALAQLPHNCTT